MKSEDTLNNYLNRLEKTLQGVSASDRAEIILEIKSHIDDATQAGTPQSEVLSSLGEPETVANRYLLERGLQVKKAPRHPLVKWISIGMLGTVGILCVTLLIGLWAFSPLVEVDEKAGTVRLLGGLINVTEEKEKTEDLKGKSQRVSESYKVVDDNGKGFMVKSGKLTIDKPKAASVEFNSGKIDINSSPDKDFHWECRFSDKSEDGFIVENSGSTAVFNFKEIDRLKCTISIPDGIATTAKGSNGAISATKPAFPLNVSLSNGKFSLVRDDKQKYAYDFKIQNGIAPELKSDTGAGVQKIEVQLSNGKIEVK